MVVSVYNLCATDCHVYFLIPNTLYNVWFEVLFAVLWVDDNDSMNREDGLTVSTSLKPLIQSLKEYTKPPHEDTKLQDLGPFQGQELQAVLLPYLLQLAVLQFPQSVISPDSSSCCFIPLSLSIAESIHPSTHPTGPPLPLTRYDDFLTHAFPM